MLVLTRKQGEQIRIGDNVVITVVRTKGKGVRLGIQAPAHVPVLRGEIAQAMANEAVQHSAVAEEESAGDAWQAGELFETAGPANRLAAVEMLGARGGRGLLREMVAARGV